MDIKSILKQFIPPIIISLLKLGVKKIPGLSWNGDYSSWAEAKNLSTGYDDNSILEACKNALLKVKNGEAVYERDSVLFDEIQYSWPLIATLQHVALVNKGHLNLIDFGGSLGSSYFQNKFFLSSIEKVNWTIVEQPHFVECGKKNFESKELNFEYSIDKALEKNSYDCLLLSAVLQTLENPFDWIEKFMQYDFNFIILDILTCARQQQLTVQYIPKSIYEASYPCYFFNENEILEVFMEKYDVITKHDSHGGIQIDLGKGRKGRFKGFFLVKK